MAREFGRDPDALQMSAFIDPKDGTLSADEMKAYRDAGASRIVLFSQPFAKAIATGQAMACIDTVAPVVEVAQGSIGLASSPSPHPVPLPLGERE